MRQYFTKIAWIYIENFRVLMVRSKGYNVFFFPGGRQESGETKKKALIREIREELSVNLIPDSINYISTFKAPSFERPQDTFVRMICYTGRYDDKLTPSEEVEEMVWFRYKDRSRTSFVDRLVFDYLKRKNFIV